MIAVVSVNRLGLSSASVVGFPVLHLGDIDV